MSDIALIYDSAVTGTADLSIAANDLAIDETLATAVYLSLFTDRHANPGDVLPDTSGDLRGWWGDVFPVVDGDQWGSRLWELSRSTLSPQLLPQINSVLSEALKWFVDDGVASSVDAQSEIVGNAYVHIMVTIYRPHVDPVKFRYSYNWAAQLATVM